MKSTNSLNIFKKHGINLLPTVLCVLYLLLLIGCDNKKNTLYHYTIRYLTSLKDIKTDNRYGIVTLSFPSYYDNDSLLLEVNGKKFLNEVISTDPISGNALIVPIDSISKIHEIGIILNRRKKITFKCNNLNQLFVIWFRQDSLIIEGVTTIPAPR
jgi:hypothetical protein